MSSQQLLFLSGPFFKKKVLTLLYLLNYLLAPTSEKIFLNLVCCSKTSLSLSFVFVKMFLNILYGSVESQAICKAEQFPGHYPKSNA
jgi:hypothetical protein